MAGNFEFQPGDAEVLADLCTQARKHCKNNPAVDTREGAVKNADFRFGDWHLLLVYETFKGQKKRWHASISCLQEVGYQPSQLPSGLVVSVPQEALVGLQSWDNEQFKQARFLLGELLGAEDKSKQQQALEHEGLFSLHWMMDLA